MLLSLYFLPLFNFSQVFFRCFQFTGLTVTLYWTLYTVHPTVHRLFVTLPQFSLDTSFPAICTSYFMYDQMFCLDFRAFCFVLWKFTAWYADFWICFCFSAWLTFSPVLLSLYPANCNWVNFHLSQTSILEFLLSLHFSLYSFIWEICVSAKHIYIVLN